MNVTKIIDRPIWTFDNASSRPTDELAGILRFVLDQADLTKSGIISVRDSAHGWFHGRAYWGEGARGTANSSKPRWAGRRRYALVLQLAKPDARYPYGAAICCWHSSGLSKLARSHSTAHAYAELQAMLDAGKTRFGRWPIYVLHTWQEATVHLAAHEVAHVLANDRGRNSQSELFCEEYAARVLAAWKEATADEQAAA